MGGSGGGGGVSSDDLKRLQAAAEERLRALASESTRLLFICEKEDRLALDARLSQSKVFPKARIAVVDSSAPHKLNGELEKASFCVVFTDKAKATPFIDKALDRVLVKKVATVHVQGGPKSLIPSKVTAYRWRSMTWDQLESIFA